MSNLDLWSKVEKTDPNYTKRVTVNRRTFTTIDAYYQIKIATGQFGMYGQTWGLKDTHIEFKEMADKTILALYKAVFFYPDGQFEVNNACKVQYITNGGKGYTLIDDDFAKKLETDTLTKCLSKLGFNADIFLGKFDDARYVNELRKEKAEKTDTTGKGDADKTEKTEDKTDKIGEKPKGNWIKDYLKLMGEQKERLGEKYYTMLADEGLQHANEIKTKEKATALYKKMKATNKED